MFFCSQAQRSATTSLTRRAPRLPPKREDHGAVACAQFGTDGFPVLRLGEHLRPDGVAHHDGLFGCAQLFHGGGHSGKHDVHIRGQQLVGHTGKGVLLMQGGLDALSGSAAHHRAADT